RRRPEAEGSDRSGDVSHARLVRRLEDDALHLAVAIAHEPPDVEALRPPHRWLPREDDSGCGGRLLRAHRSRRATVRSVQGEREAAAGSGEGREGRAAY